MDTMRQDTEIQEVKDKIAVAEAKVAALEDTIAVTADQIAAVEQQLTMDLKPEKMEKLEQEKILLRQKEIILWQTLQQREVELVKLKAGTPGGKDRSEAWIKYMLLPQRPELPKNRADLTKVLFPEPHQKLPVSKEVYNQVEGGTPNLAAKFLVAADGSVLPCAIATFLKDDFEPVRTEMDTSVTVGFWLRRIFRLFEKYSEVGSKLKILFNCNGRGQGSYSRTIVSRKRPDTIGIAVGCTFLIGEDKVDDLHEAEGDIISKIKPLNPMFYGELDFILGYIAAGSTFQWLYIGKNGSKDVHPIGGSLDLSNITDRCYFALSVGYACQLSKTMIDSVPHVPGRRAMFSKDETEDGKRVIWFYSDVVVKHIKDFDSYSADQMTSLSEIQGAYDAAVAAEGSFLPRAVTGPTVSAHGTYKVECSPIGYSCIFKSEEDCRWMAQCVCQALSILHGAGLVHRDIRVANIVRLSEMKFVLIDLESVAKSPFRLSEGFRYFSHWNSGMLEGNLYTPLSDMYSLGKLLDTALPEGRTALAKNFLRKLTSKQLSASNALQDPWLSDLML